MFESLDDRINNLINSVGKDKTVSSRKFFIGKNDFIEAAIVFIEAFVDKEVIKRDILTPLMARFDELNISKRDGCEFINKKYITASSSKVEYDMEKTSDAVLSGNTAILIDGLKGIIIVDTKGGNFRSITDPPNESAISGTREGFIENIDTNISLIRRNIKDKNLSVENLRIGDRSQTELVLVYIDDIVDRKVLAELKSRLSKIDVDSISDSGILKQYI